MRVSFSVFVNVQCGLGCRCHRAGRQTPTSRWSESQIAQVLVVCTAVAPLVTVERKACDALTEPHKPAPDVVVAGRITVCNYPFVLAERPML